MPKVRALTDSGRQAARWAQEDDAIRQAVRVTRAYTGHTLDDMAAAMGMTLRTLQRRMQTPGDMRLNELRALRQMAERAGAPMDGGAMGL